MAHSVGTHTNAVSSLISDLVDREKVADLCLQLLRLQMQFRISTGHCHASIQLTQTFGGE